jgi:hypothetical protein
VVLFLKTTDGTDITDIFKRQTICVICVISGSVLKTTDGTDITDIFKQ